MRRENAKIQINTLSPYVGFGGGSYQMSDVKRMTAKEDFLKMPLKDRNCEVELYEDCRTRKLLKECDCVPWELPGVQVKFENKNNNLDPKDVGRFSMPASRKHLLAMINSFPGCQRQPENCVVCGKAQQLARFQ